ncbi:MAG: U32 family peptidase [Bacillota bacterium]|nr:U32 family peptidase [Bacillota bacterium]
MGKNRQRRNLYFYCWEREYMTAAVKSDRVSVNIKEFEYDDNIEDFTKLKNSGVEICAYLPVLWKGETSDIEEISDIVYGVYVGNAGQIMKVKKADVKMFADAYMNIYNDLTVKTSAEQGFDGAVLSYELDSENREIYEEVKKYGSCSETELEVLRYGRVPAMISEYCPLAGAEGVRGTGCGKCMEHNPVFLKDSYGDRYPVLLDDTRCTSLILSREPLNRKKSAGGLKYTDRGMERITVFDESPGFIARL